MTCEKGGTWTRYTEKDDDFPTQKRRAGWHNGTTGQEQDHFTTTQHLFLDLPLYTHYLCKRKRKRTETKGDAPSPPKVPYPPFPSL